MVYTIDLEFDRGKGNVDEYTNNDHHHAVIDDNNSDSDCSSND